MSTTSPWRAALKEVGWILGLLVLLTQFAYLAVEAELPLAMTRTRAAYTGDRAVELVLLEPPADPPYEAVVVGDHFFRRQIAGALPGRRLLMLPLHRMGLRALASLRDPLVELGLPVIAQNSPGYWSNRERISEKQDLRHWKARRSHPWELLALKDLDRCLGALEFLAQAPTESTEPKKPRDQKYRGMVWEPKSAWRWAFERTGGQREPADLAKLLVWVDGGGNPAGDANRALHRTYAKVFRNGAELSWGEAVSLRSLAGHLGSRR